MGTSVVGSGANSSDSPEEWQMAAFGQHPESMLEKIFNDVQIAAAAVDAQHRLIYANDLALQVLGIPRTIVDSQLRVEDLFRNYHHFDWRGNDVPTEHWPVMRALAGEDAPPFNIKFVLPNGSFRWLHVTNHRFSVFGLSGILIVATDETKEVELQKVAASVEKFKVLSELVGGLAHNFNNILSVIGLTAFECLGDSDIGPDTRAKLQSISDACQNAGSLVKRLAQFSRTQPLQPQPTPTNQLISKALVLAGPLLRTESINLIENLNPDLPDVDVDPVEMEQVILNLMLNARDAMPNGGQLTVSTEVCVRPSDVAIRDADKQCVAITVSDTGSGIPQGDLDHIFEPFFTTKPNGIGLGLASAHGIVRQHGGDIRVQSVLGSGTRFTVYLPPSRRKEEAVPGGSEKAA
jgi:signal transduction histidine kinase